MDETQRLDWAEDDEGASVDRVKPVAFLHMFCGQHGPAQDFPIYWGQNIIGRHAKCDVTLPAQSVSKRHAIIEVQAGCHTLCDQGSLNKTRRSKAALSPNVRYALAHGDLLLFADVACQYKVQEVKATPKPEEEEEVLEEESDDDDSVLVPGTQNTLALEKTPGVAIRRMGLGGVLAKDSGEEDNEDEEQGDKSWNIADGGLGSSRGGRKISSVGTLSSHQSDTFVPESDEEMETSTSEPQCPSLNLRCDSDTDTHETPTRGSTIGTPSQDYITSPAFRGVNLPLRKEANKSDTTGNEKPSIAGEEERKRPQQPDIENASDLKGRPSLPEVKEETSSALVEADSSAANSNITVTGHVEQDVVTPTATVEEQGEDHLHLGSDAEAKQTNTKQQEAPDVEGVDTTTAIKEINVTENILASITYVAGDQKADQEGPGSNAFHMESDTDGEDDKSADVDLKREEPVETHLGGGTDVADDVKPSNTGARNELVEVHLDSDTDVEDVEKSNLKIEEMNDVEADIDTDTDEDDGPSKINVKKRKPPGVNLDSDTDVEEDYAKTTVEKSEISGVNPDIDTSVEDAAKPTKTDVDQGESAGTKLDSDTDMEEDDIKPSKKTSINLGSDTDVEDDNKVPKADMNKKESNQVSLQEATKVEDKTALAACRLDSDTDVEDEPEALNSKATSALNPAEEEDSVDDSTSRNEERSGSAQYRLDSDTDVEEEPTEAGRIGSKQTVELAKPEARPAQISLDSDTDVEEEDKAAEASGEKGASTDVTAQAIEGGDLVREASREEAAEIPAGVKETNLGGPHLSDSEGTELDMLATQCYLDPPGRESDVPDDDHCVEDATQAYIFSSTWDQDPFKRPADPIEALQISAVTLNTSEEEIDENVIAETQPFCFETPPRGDEDSRKDQLVTEKDRVQETAQSGSHMEKTKEMAMQGSQDDTEPVSQYLATRVPKETDASVHLRPEAPISTCINNTLQERDNAQEEEATQAYSPGVAATELDATQAYTLDVPDKEISIMEEDETQNVLTVEEDATQLCITATESDATQPCIPNVPGKEEDETQLSMTTTESDATQPCIPSVPAKEEDETQLSMTTVSDATQHCIPSVPAQEEDETQLSMTTTENDATQPCIPSVPAKEEDATQLSMTTTENDATQPCIPSVPAKEEDATQLSMTTTENDATQPCILIVPAKEEDATQLSMTTTENDATQPCIPSVPAKEEDATQWSMTTTENDATQPCIPSVPAKEEDATKLSMTTTESDSAQPSVLKVPVPLPLSMPTTEIDATQLTAPATERDTAPEEEKEPPSRRGLCRSKRRAKEEPTEIAAKPQVASKNEELSGETNVQQNSPVNEDTEELGEPTKGLRDPGKGEEEGAENEVKQRVGRRTRRVEVGANKAEEVERISSATERKRKKTTVEAEPSTSEPTEEGTRKRATRKSAVKRAIVKEAEEEDKDIPESAPEESGASPVSSAHEEQAVGIVDKQKDIDTEKSEDLPNEEESKQNLCSTGKETTSSVKDDEITKAKEMMDISTHEEQEQKSRGRKNVRGKKRATAIKNNNIEEAGSGEQVDDGDSIPTSTNEQQIGNSNLQGCSDQEEVKRQLSRRLGSSCSVQEDILKKTEEEPSKKKRFGRKSQVVSETPEKEEKIARSRDPTAENEEATEAGTRSRKAVSRGVERTLREGPSRKAQIKEPAGKQTLRMRKTSTEEEEGGTLKEAPVPRRGRSNSKEEEKRKTKQVNEEISKPEKVVPVKKSRNTKKGLMAESGKHEGTEGVNKSDEASGKQEVEEVEKSQIETPIRQPRRTRRNSKEEVEMESQDVKATPRRTKNSSREEKGKQGQEKEEIGDSKTTDTAKKPTSRQARRNSKVEERTEQVIEETAAKDPVGKPTSRRTRKNSKDNEKSQGENELEKAQAETDVKSKKPTPKTRRKKPSEEEESGADVELKKECSGGRDELTSQEGEPRTSRSRRTAAKDGATPAPARKRGQGAKVEEENEVKRKKSAADTQQSEGDGNTVPMVAPSNQRRRSVAAAVEKAETRNNNRKNSSSPALPSTPTSTRSRPRTVSSSPSETRTPRRTNRAAGTTSPFSSQGPPKVLFTGVVDATGEEIIRSLGGEIADSVFDCTHLVTDRVRRTVKFLCAVARGIPIVTLDWIDKCKKSGCFLSHSAFLVKDKEQEKIFNFTLAESLQKAKRKPLFEGYEIHVTPNVKPEPEHMKEIIQCSGGTFLLKKPRAYKEKRIIVSCSEDLPKCKPAPASVPVTTTEFILSGILRQEAEPSSYLLSTGEAEPGPVPAKRRR